MVERKLSSTLIQIQQLSKTDPIRGHILVHPTDARINAGERIVLSGPSGSGKSVFLRCLAQIEPLSTGQIYFKNELIRSQNVQNYRTQVNYVRQTPILIDGTVMDNIRLGFSLELNQDKPFDKNLLCHYLHYFNKPEGFIHQNSAVLSGGERQIVSFLRNLMLMPTMLLLDEPTAALDPDSVLGFERLVDDWLQADQQRAYIWISHDPQQAERMASQRWHMQAGRLHCS